MTYSGQLTVSFLSEWHCGTGAGKHGGIDRSIALDDEGLPYVPGRTLKGLWRDACERVGYALDDGRPGDWSRLARRLFGDPALAAEKGESSRSLVHVRDAHLPAAWRERLFFGRHEGEADVLVPGLRVTRAGAAISKESGTAEPDHLRLIEFARCGLGVEAAFQVDAPKHWAIDLLLAAGLQELTVLGGHRRRGAGRCRVTTDAFGHLAALVSEHRNEVGTWRLDTITWTQDKAAWDSAPTAASTEPLVPACRVLLTLLQPVVCARAVLGNLILAHDYIPGATLLPVVAKALGSQTSSLVRAGRVIVTDAVPTPGKERLAPTPLCIVSGQKGEAWLDIPEEVHDARERVVEPSERPVNGWALRRPDGAWRVVRPHLTTTAHASVDDDSQRTLENGVYSIQAIPAGSRLSWDVWLPRDLKDTFTSALPDRISVGRYRHDSYGLAEVEVLPPPEDRSLPDVGAGDELSLWLTSDACIEDATGIPDTTPSGFANAVERALAVHGIRATLAVVEDRTFASATRRDSWSGSISLPRATIAGLHAGSVLTLHTDAHIPGTTLRAVLDRGIGQRRAEGFGRCEVLPVTTNQEIRPWSGGASPQVPFDGTPSGEQPPGWSDVRRAIWRTEIQQRIKVVATDQAVRTEFLAAGASASNLGSLRTAAMALASDPEAVGRWLERTEAHPSRRELWAAVTKALSAHFAAENLEAPTNLHAWFRSHQAASARDLPGDLGGNAPQKVASWLLVELLRRQTLATQDPTGEES